METNTTTPVTRDEWTQALEFANRFEADLHLMNAKGAEVHPSIHNAANELTNLANDIVFNGGIYSEWKTDLETVYATRAALRATAAASIEFEMFLDILEAKAKAEVQVSEGESHVAGVPGLESLWQKKHALSADLVQLERDRKALAEERRRLDNRLTILQGTLRLVNETIAEIDKEVCE